MDSENIVTFQLQLTRRKAWLLLTAFFICWHPGFLGSETLTLTTYYPAPFGGYVSLLTTGRTLLARDPGATSMVGIGTSTPLSKLHVQGAGGGTIDMRVNGRIQTGDAGNAGGVWLSQNGNMLVGQNGNSAAIQTGGVWRFNISQGGVTTTGGATPQVGDVAGDLRVGGTLRGLCSSVAYWVNGGGSCGLNEQVVSWRGNGVSIDGMLFRGGAIENPGAWTTYVSVGGDRVGSLLCCRIQ
jgi:hypothetical protein